MCQTVLAIVVLNSQYSIKINEMEETRQTREQGLLEQVSDLQRQTVSLKQKCQSAESLNQRQQRDAQIKEQTMANQMQELEQRNRDV